MSLLRITHQLLYIVWCHKATFFNLLKYFLYLRGYMHLESCSKRRGKWGLENSCFPLRSSSEMQLFTGKARCSKTLGVRETTQHGIFLDADLLLTVHRLCEHQQATFEQKGTVSCCSSYRFCLVLFAVHGCSKSPAFLLQLQVVTKPYDIHDWFPTSNCTDDGCSYTDQGSCAHYFTNSF